MKAKRPRAKSGSHSKNKRTQLVYPHGDLSIEEWSDTRSAIYSELRFRSIPMNIIQAVEEGRQHAPVSWMCPWPKTADDDILPIVDRPGKDSWREESIQLGASSDKDKLIDYWPKTAGETLSYFLSAEIDFTRRSSDAPVRRGKQLPKATVAWVANDLLEGCDRFPPGCYLKELLGKLLEVDRLKKNQSKQFVARTGAIWIIAQAPQLDSQEVARELGIDRSSVSRWRRHPDFQRQVANRRGIIDELKKEGKWSTFQWPLRTFGHRFEPDKEA